MSIFWILAIIAAALIIFSGIFGFRGAGRAGWGILKILFFIFIVFLIIMIVLAIIR